MYTYYHTHDGYSRRHETRLVEQDGTKAPALLITRYTYRYTWQTRGVEGPRGGKARRQRAKYVFYRAGRFYRGRKILCEDGRRMNGYEPFDGVIFDAYAKSSAKQGVPIVSIELVEGVPVEVRDADGKVVWSWFDHTITQLEDLLQVPEQDRAPAERTEEPEEATTEEHTIATTEETTTETESTEEREAFEAARTAWIESTTNTGDQLDLVAWFGYGDASWQELAAPAA